MQAIRRALGLDHDAPPITDESERTRAIKRVMEQTRRVQMIDHRIEAERAKGHK